jgi:acyl-CoA synthetase (NDP forming)
MKSLILAAASAVALGIGGVGVGHAALTSTPGPSSSSGQTLLWEQGYGMYATPTQMARVWKEVAHYRQLAAQSQQQRHASATPETKESLGHGAPV